MKTAEALCRDLLGNPGLFAALEESVKTGKVEDFLRAQDCGASPAELNACLHKQAVEPPEQDLERVAGGDALEFERKPFPPISDLRKYLNNGVETNGNQQKTE